jgi:hypothetical protein
MEESAGREGWGATGGEAGSNAGLEGEVRNQDLTGLVQSHHRRQMDSQGWRCMQRDADGAVVRSGCIEQGMHVANRQHHRQQQQQDAGGNGGLADSGLKPCLHRSF